MAQIDPARVDEGRPSDPSSDHASARRPAKGWRTALLQKLRTALANRVPLGYQDYSGFHFGVKPYEEDCGYQFFW